MTSMGVGSISPTVSTGIKATGFQSWKLRPDRCPSREAPPTRGDIGTIPLENGSYQAARSSGFGNEMQEAGVRTECSPNKPPPGRKLTLIARGVLLESK